MCGGDLGQIIDNPITQIVSDVIATATGNPELIPVINAGETYAGTGSLKDAAISGGTAFGAQELTPLLTNAVGFTDPSVAGGNSLTDLFGQTSGAGSLAGPGTIGGDISGAASNLANFSPASGLQSFLGGTPQNAGTFSADASSIANAPGAGAAVAGTAATPSASIASSALPSGAGIGGTAAGGAAGGGLDIGNVGESIAAPSASGVGGSLNLAPLSTDFGSQPVTTALGTNEGAGLFGAPNAATPVVTGSLAGGGASDIGGSLGQGLGTSVPAGTDFTNGGLASAIPTATPGGSNVGSASNILGNLFGGGNGSGGTQMINGLLRSGLSGLFNNPNNAGFDAQMNAGNQIQSDYAPFLKTGQQANSTLADLFGLNGAAPGAQAGAQANFENTPGYQFARDQGLKAVNANAAKMGQTLSGNNQQAVQQYGTGLADQTYNQYVQNLQNQAGQGISAAGGVATGQAGVGNAQAGKSGAAANNQNSTLAGVLASLFPQNGISFGSNGLNINNGNSGLLSLFAH